MQDMSTLIPIMYGILFAGDVLYCCAPSVVHLRPLIMISLSAMAAMGVAGWLGIRLSAAFRGCTNGNPDHCHRRFNSYSDDHVYRHAGRHEQTSGHC